jgi:hypothetical protein
MQAANQRRVIEASRSHRKTYENGSFVIVISGCLLISGAVCTLKACPRGADGAGKRNNV